MQTWKHKKIHVQKHMKCEKCEKDYAEKVEQVNIFIKNPKVTSNNKETNKPDKEKIYKMSKYIEIYKI